MLLSLGLCTALAALPQIWIHASLDVGRGDFVADRADWSVVVGLRLDPESLGRSGGGRSGERSTR